MNFDLMEGCQAPEAGDAARYLLKREWIVATYASLFITLSHLLTKIKSSSPDPGINQDPHPDASGHTLRFRHQVRDGFEPRPAVFEGLAVPSRFL